MAHGARLIFGLLWTRCPSRPHQQLVILIAHQLLGIDEFGHEVFELVSVEGETPFKRPIGYALLALDQVNGLSQEVIECHV